MSNSCHVSFHLWVIIVIFFGEVSHGAEDRPDQPIDGGPLTGFRLVSEFERRRGPWQLHPWELHLLQDGDRAPDLTVPVKLTDGRELKWEPVTLDAEGRVPAGEGPQGGWIHLPLNSPQNETRILNVAGTNAVYVNGEPRAGDVYGYGYLHLPISLRTGTNHLYVNASGRGTTTIRLDKPVADIYLIDQDATLPDLVVGESTMVWGSIVAMNATPVPQSHLRLIIHVPDSPPAELNLPVLPPLTPTKVPFSATFPAAKADAQAVSFSMQLARSGSTENSIGPPVQLSLRVKLPEHSHKRTFVSQTDGSVQYYGIRRAIPLTPEDPLPAIVLSCHGASVEAIGQSDSYSSKSWLHLVAPTNRRPYGFDWEDIGRTDALEVLQLAKQELPHDPQRIYLTGHSMGGHGTWHLGSTFPDRFAAIGPSAGWLSYASYARGRLGQSAPITESPIQQLVRRGELAGDTELLSSNLKQLAIFILHGGADDNVPAEQAQRMAKVLGEMHYDWIYHEEPGQPHWWSNEYDDGGAACMDWPAMYDLFARHALPPTQSVRFIDFATANPGVSAHCHWLSIAAQRQHHALARAQVHVWPNRRRFRGTTENCELLSLQTRFLSGSGPVEVELDGQSLGPLPVEPGAPLWLARRDKEWQVTSPPSPTWKGPHRYGAVKDELRNQFVMVYGTRGSESDNRAIYAKARFDAETYFYRGNATPTMLADVDFQPEAYADRTVVLYGNSDNNIAWRSLLMNSPVQIRDGEVILANERIAGDDMAAMFVRPRADSPVASVIAIGATGPAGMRAGFPLSLFVPFVRYPDCLVVRLATEESGLQLHPVMAGYFGIDWSVERGEFLRR